MTEKIEKAVLFAPKLVTINMKERPVEEVVKELARQTGYKLQFQGNGPQKITIEMTNVTYWQALEKICNDGQLTPGFDNQEGLVFLYQNNTLSPYVDHRGPFRFVAQTFNYNRYVNLANLPRNGIDPNNNQYENSLNFSFMIQSEPKVALLSVSPPRLTHAEDENGVSLLPRLEENQQFNVQYNDGNGLFRNYQHSVAAQMAKPAKDSQRAKLVKGKVVVTVLSGSKPDVVIEKLVAGKKKRTGFGASADIEVEDMVEQNNTWTITMVVKRHVKNGEQPDYNWVNSIQQKFELYDDQGRKFQSQGVSNFINNSPTAVHASYQFTAPPDSKLGPATKLVLAEWLTLSHELEFEFKDLPLP